MTYDQRFHTLSPHPGLITFAMRRLLAELTITKIVSSSEKAALLADNVEVAERFQQRVQSLEAQLQQEHQVR